ncbi:MAG: helix-turn-helix transcriptional regulator [Slackia sp.]|nr:helix-turn-helix transcriptional regulator [Slackia sp.]
MGKSAEFRARREICGLTQGDVADACGVRLLTVKRWEKLGEAEPPADAWEFLEGVEAARRAVVRQAVEAAAADKPGAVRLTYCRTQEQYDALGRGGGPVGVANANARAVADLLESMGIAVAWAYPDEEGFDAAIG